MEKEKYLEDLKDIREMMAKSSKFISLSGLSGVVAGICALTGAYFAYNTVYSNQEFIGYQSILITNDVILKLVLIAFLVLLVSISTIIFLTTRKARKNNQNIWDVQTKRLLINLAIPLTAGGILCLILLVRGYVGLLGPLTLVFYGLALVNVSKYTLAEVRGLGLFEILLGLLGVYFIGYGLLFWAIGFGFLHIIYGVIMQIKYGS